MMDDADDHCAECGRLLVDQEEIDQGVCAECMAEAWCRIEDNELA